MPVQGAEKAVEASLKSDAFDTVVATGSKAVSIASPYANKAASFLGSTDPLLLGKSVRGVLGDGRWKLAVEIN